jgi:hypothetical protein
MFGRVVALTTAACGVALMSLTVVAGASANTRATYDAPSMYAAPCSNGAQAVRPSELDIWNCFPFKYQLGYTANLTHIHWTTYRHSVATGRGQFLGRWCLVKEFRPKYLSYGAGAAAAFTGWAFTGTVLHSPNIARWQSLGHVRLSGRF